MTVSGFNQNDTLKIAAWQKALIVGTHDPSYARQDRFGKWIVWSDYGKSSDYGWEIDHLLPTSLGGLDIAQNVAATHWQANRAKSNRFIG